MENGVILRRKETGENGTVYAPESGSLRAMLGEFTVLGPGPDGTSLRLMDEKGWRKFYELNRKLSLEDSMAVRKMLAMSARAELEEETLAIPAQLMKFSTLGERCRLFPVWEGVWQLSPVDDGGMR
jgi:hypothetical protein